MEQFLFRGHMVSYIDVGQGEPILFLHNGGNSHRIWDHQIAHFRKTHRVLATDHLGWGDSDKPRIDYDLPLFSDMVAAFVDELRLAPVTLVGNCMGSAMSLHYTMQHPDKVNRLILCNLNSEKHLLAGPLASVYQTFSKRRLVRNWMSLKVDLFGLSRKKTDEMLRSQYGRNPPDDPEFADYIYELYNRKGQIRALYNNLSVSDRLRPIDEFMKPKNFPPLCVIWGKENFILPASAGEQFCQRVKPEQVDFLDGCGHLPMREKPELVNQKIEEFLSRQFAPRETVSAGL